MRGAQQPRRQEGRRAAGSCAGQGQSSTRSNAGVVPTLGLAAQRRQPGGAADLALAASMSLMLFSRSKASTSRRSSGSWVAPMATTAALPRATHASTSSPAHEEGRVRRSGGSATDWLACGHVLLSHTPQTAQTTQQAQQSNAHARLHAGCMPQACALTPAGVSGGGLHSV